jgi:ferritin-like metal-binding protein YciE
MKLETLKDLYLEELKDVYDAENQILKALPKMTKAASSDSLRDAFQEHEEVTRSQVDRLEQIFDRLGTKAKGKKCKAMEGLVAEAKELMEEDADEDVMDAGLIAAAQRVEHYEIAVYGTLQAYAEQLGFDEDSDLLQETLDEEKDADSKLSELATACINLEAEGEEGAEREQEEEEKGAPAKRAGSRSVPSRRS